MGFALVIALYVHELRATGVVRQTLALAAHLAAEGRDVAIVTARPGGGVPAGVDRVALLGEDAPGGMAGKLAAALALRRWCARARPRLLVSMGNHGHVSALLGLAARAAPPRLVFRISNDIDRAAPGAPAGGRVRRWLRRVGARIIAARADALVAVAPQILDSPAFAKARAEGRAHAIVNGIDAAAALARAHGGPPHRWLADRGRTILAAGRLDPQKNFETLIDALALMQGPDAPRLIIIGSSRRTGQCDALRAWAVERGVGGRVDLIDHADNVFLWFAYADCFVLPSWWEGSANVLLEAMAVGAPVAASHSAGNAADLLGRGRYGWLFAPHDARAMARAIAAQLAPESRLMPTGALARYGAPAVLARWSALIDGLDEPAPARRRIAAA